MSLSLSSLLITNTREYDTFLLIQYFYCGHKLNLRNSKSLSVLEDEFLLLWTAGHR